jgi:hypothetical protein
MIIRAFAICSILLLEGCITTKQVSRSGEVAVKEVTPAPVPSFVSPSTSLATNGSTATTSQSPTVALTPITAVISPVYVDYEDEAGGKCDPNGFPHKCKEQIADYRKKYWRFELVEPAGGMRDYLVSRPELKDVFKDFFWNDKSVLSQSFYVKKEGQVLEVPVSAHTYVNGRFTAEGVAIRPDVLSSWSLGAKEDIEDVRVAAVSGVVANNTTQFVQVFNAAIKALSTVNKITAAAIAIPGVSDSMAALEVFEKRINAARDLNQPFTVQTLRVYPRYLKHIDIKARDVNGAITADTLYRVIVDKRDSLFIRDASEPVALSNVLGFTLPSGSGTTRLVSALSKDVVVPADGPIEYVKCKAVFDEAGAKGLNELDQALVTAAWLNGLDWNTNFSRRDSGGECYALLSSRIGEKNQYLMASNKQMEREVASARNLSDLALGEITVIFTGENIELANKRFDSQVRIESAEENDALNKYFGADLHLEGTTLTSGQLLSMFKTTEQNPIVFTRQVSPCFRPASSSTSSMVIETRCISIKNLSGTAQPYKTILGLDRSIFKEPGKAAIRSIRFESIKK